MKQIPTLVIGLVVCVLRGNSIAQETQRVDAVTPTDVASNAIQRTTAANKYVVLVFHRKGENTTALRETVKKAVDVSKGRAESVEVDASDPACQPTVRKYGVDRAPLPIVLVIAPNGAVTGRFPGSCDARMLSDAMVGRTFAACLKNLQSGKLVFVAVAGTNAASNQAAMKGINEMAADERFIGYTETLQVQAEDKDSADLLAKLNVTDAGPTPVTVLLAPPGRVVGTYKGATDKETMVADLIKAMSGASCGSGGGCGSGAGRCNPQ